MNILSIDTVLNKTYVALLLNGKEIFKSIKSDENNYHSAYLIRVLNDILISEKSSLKEIDYIGANTGTGSFTGIRVGLSIAKIISNRLNIKTVPFKTFEVLSKAYGSKNIMLDARRNSVFYSNDGVSAKLISYDDAKEILQKSDNKFICDDSLLSRFKEYTNKLISFEKEDRDLSKIELEIVKEKIKKGETTNFAGLKPTYIQTPPIYSKN